MVDDSGESGQLIDAAPDRIKKHNETATATVNLR